jgi:NAD(P)-dependent dehydrogenase (short-subunit alcohol dehydrogenase family)
VQDLGSLVELRDAVVAEFGGVDVLVVASGLNRKAPSLDFSVEEFEQVLDVNLTGVFRANQVFGRPMIEQGGGSIINIASIAGLRSILQMAAYSAGKAGVVALTEALAAEWAPHKVRVNSIAPGPFVTPLSAKVLAEKGRREYVTGYIPLGRFGELEELVGAAVYLASDASSYMTGATLRVDGGILAKGF